MKGRAKPCFLTKQNGSHQIMNKNLLYPVFALVSIVAASAEPLEPIQLLKPNFERGLPVMTALSERASASEFDSADLKLEDLSDLIWAAYGINRPDEGKRTASSAVNAQDLDLYVVLKEGVYIYNAAHHVLNPIEAGDYRELVADRQKVMATAPVFCLLVSDVSKFPVGSEEQKMQWGAISTGIVSQNISLFCAATNLATRPRATMNQGALRELLFLDDSQILMLNHPVGYEL